MVFCKELFNIQKWQERNSKAAAEKKRFCFKADWTNGKLNLII